MAEIDKKKRSFSGEWIRTTETNFAKFLRFNGVAYLMSFPLSKRGSNMRFQISDDGSSITVESTGIPFNPKTTLPLNGDKVVVDVKGRACEDRFFWSDSESAAALPSALIDSQFMLISTREDYNRSDGIKINVVITRKILEADPDTLISTIIATKSDNSSEECQLVFSRNKGASLF